MLIAKLRCSNSPGATKGRLSNVFGPLREHLLKRSLALIALTTVFCQTYAGQKPLNARASLPRPDHIVIVVEENHSFKQIIGSPKAEYINLLVKEGAVFSNFYALHHPSQPNYFVLFSGDRQGIFDDKCEDNRPLIANSSIGGQLIEYKLTFVGYAEGLPEVGSKKCSMGKYKRKHAPWISFKDIPSSASRPFSDFPIDFNTLPTLAMVIPHLDHDMHDPIIGPKVKNGDKWLRENLGSYVEWAKTHNSLLIVTWDEDDRPVLIPRKATKPPANQIPTILIGEMVKSGIVSNNQYTHLDLLRTIQEMYGLPPLPGTQNASVITDVWK